MEEVQLNEAKKEVQSEEESNDENESDNTIMLYRQETVVADEAYEGQAFKYACDFAGCGKSFTRRQARNQHMTTHTGERKIKCDECDLVFFTSSQKYKHKEAYHKRLTFSCKTCDKQFCSKSSLAKHMECHQGNRELFLCEVCQAAFLHSTDLNKHMKTHVEPEGFQCAVCFKSFGYKNSLRRHEKIHLNEKPHACDTCDQRFIQKCDLTKHMQSHNRSAGSAFKCKVCNLEFTRKDSLARHFKSHRPNLSCPVESCWDKFPSKHSLLAHLRTDHNRLEVEPVMTSLTFLDRPPEEEDCEAVDNPDPLALGTDEHDDDVHHPHSSAATHRRHTTSMHHLLMGTRMGDDHHPPPPPVQQDILVDIETQALENAGIFVDKTCVFTLEDELDAELSTGQALVNESVLQSMQRDRELEEHKFVIAE
eukprot:TRINITY_DN4194_c0_g1_i3.p1 TRINITY_DN4194_c0_g1~~TRINITY_DN4194_c0_g1_i3.p1  ORF type:complete len:422 (+),score=64.85 TRINITY_DN4194_c0_g1_i3:57-1322(+)